MATPAVDTAALTPALGLPESDLGIEHFTAPGVDGPTSTGCDALCSADANTDG